MTTLIGPRLTLRPSRDGDAQGRLALGRSAEVMRMFGADPDALVAAIAEVVAAHGPDEVLVTGEDDPHEDHAVLGAATRRALVGTGVRMLTYPIWQFDRPARLVRYLRRGARPELVRTDGYRERKREAVAAYPSQMAAHNDDPEGLKPNFLPNFDGPYEMFFPVDLTAGNAKG